MKTKLLPALACVPFLTVPSLGFTPHLDPVTTFTNGMSLPSTDPMRTHNVNYKCDRYRSGCCGGRYNYACLSHLLFPNTCCADRKTPPSVDCTHKAGSYEAVEPEGVVMLGNLPASASGLGIGGGAPPPRQQGGALGGILGGGR